MSTVKIDSCHIAIVVLHFAADASRRCLITEHCVVAQEFLENSAFPDFSRLEAWKLALSAGNSGSGSLEDVAVTAVRRAFDANGGNVSATAKALGVSRDTVYRKLNLR